MADDINDVAPPLRQHRQKWPDEKGKHPDAKNITLLVIPRSDTLCAFRTDRQSDKESLCQGWQIKMRLKG